MSKKSKAKPAVPEVKVPEVVTPQVVLPEPPKKQHVNHKTFPDYVREAFRAEVQKEFSFLIDDRLQVIADTEHYNASVDHSVWLQKRDEAPKMFEVYWDGEWIMDFSTDTEEPIIFAIFWNGFYKAYTENRIRLNRGLAETEFKDLNVMIESNKKKLVVPKTPTEIEAERLIAELAQEKKEGKWN